MPKRIALYVALHKNALLITLASLALYYYFAHFLLRTDYFILLALFASLFFASYKLIQFEKWNYKLLIAIGILFRLAFITSEPNLSQDYYRFIWDGELVRNLINPYLHTPNTLVENTGAIMPNAQQLLEGMGTLSAQNFSNYPPLNQIIFGLAALFGTKGILGSVLILRLFMVTADLGIVYFGRKLLKYLNLAPHLIFWYYLNPLVIIELTGNLHFEGVMIFFFTWAMYLISNDRWHWAAIAYGCSIAIKLVPLLFLPVFIKYFGAKRSIAFYALVGFTCLLLFLPFYTPDFLGNYTRTLSLWFSNFEFNASFYNVIKQIAAGFDIKPWHLIKSYGKITPFITVLLILLLTVAKKNTDLPSILRSMLWLLTGYFLISTTVHPWYLVFLVILGIFSGYRYPLLWSMVVVLSYLAYSNPNFKENLWVLAVEYTLVYGAIVFEIVTRGGKKVLLLKKKASH